MNVQLKKISCTNCKHSTNSVFADIDKETLDLIDKSKTVNSYNRGQALFLQDNPSFGVFCIHTGKLKITKADSLGSDAIVRLVNPGQIIGHPSLLADEPHYASAVAIEDCTACFIDKKSIVDIICRSPIIALNIIKALSMSLRASELHAASKSQQNVREKLAGLFLSLMKTNGVKIGEHCKLDIKLTREELGSIIGSTTETVCRFITEFKNEGLIEEHDKYIYVINEDKLQKFTNNH